MRIENWFVEFESVQKDNSSRIDNLIREHMDLETSIEKIKEVLNKKTDIGSTRRLDEKLLVLSQSLQRYVLKETVDDLEHTVATIQEHVAIKMDKQEVNDTFQQTVLQIDKKLELLATKEDLEHDFNRADFILNKNIKKVREEIKELKQLEGKITDFALKLNKYSSKAEVNEKVKEVWKNFDKCCSYDHIIEFKREMEPRMVEWESNVADYKLDLISNQQIIRRFDEVITTKASKFSIDKLYEKFQDYHKLEKFDEYVKESKKLHREHRSSLEELDEKVGFSWIFFKDDISCMKTQLNNLLKTDLNHYSYSHISFKVDKNHSEIVQSMNGSLGAISMDVEHRILVGLKGKCIDRDELSSHLWHKADRWDIEKLHSIKADKSSSNDNVCKYFG